MKSASRRTEQYAAGTGGDVRFGRNFTRARASLYAAARYGIRRAAGDLLGDALSQIIDCDSWYMAAIPLACATISWLAGKFKSRVRRDREGR